MNNFPPRDLPGRAEAWGRDVETKLATQDGDLARLTQTVNNLSRGTQGSIQTITNLINELQTKNLLLEEVSKTYTSSDLTTWTGVTTWVPSAASITVASTTGRFQVTVGGGASGGTAAFTFSAPGFDRERAKGGTASAIDNRTTAIGGVSASGSTSRTWLIQLEPGTPHTFTGEAFCFDNFSSVIGLFITVQPAL